MFDLSLTLFEGEGGLHGRLDFDRDLFDRSTVARWARGFEGLLAAAVADPARPVGRLPLLPAAAAHQVAYEWNDTELGAAPAEGFLARFDRLAAAQPEAVAVSQQGHHLTYGALALASRRVAAGLAALGVGPEARVGVCVERRPELPGAPHRHLARRRRLRAARRRLPREPPRAHARGQPRRGGGDRAHHP